MTQTLSVAQDSIVQISLWASAPTASAAGAVQVRVGAAAPAVVALPAGPFPWTRFSVAYHVPLGTTAIPLTVVAAGPTDGMLVDGISAQGQGSGGVVVNGGGFDSSSATIRILNPSLVLRPSDEVQVESRLAPAAAYRWRLDEYTGGDRIAGRGMLRSGEAAFSLSEVPSGYYHVTLSLTIGGREVDRATDLVVAPPPTSGSSSSPLLGVGVHLGGESDPQLAQKVADLAALGLRAARTDADWATIESAPGRYDFTGLDRVVAALRAGGLRPLLIVDYKNPLYDRGRTPSSPAGIAAYARFAAAVAARNPDADIEVYNEYDFHFNSSACGKTPACYRALLGPTTAAVRATGTTGVVAGPALAGLGVQLPWLQEFIAQGGLRDVGALTFHPYVQPERPDVLDAPLTELRASMATAGAGDAPIWFTEFGDATTRGRLTERQQAEDAARVVGIAAAHAVTRVYWYDAFDDGPNPDDPEDNFGLFRAPTSVTPGALVPKPAAAVLATAARLTAGTTPVAGLSTSASGLRQVGFDVEDGSARTVAWASQDDEQVDLKGNGSLTSMTGRPMRSAHVLKIGASPVWLSGGLRISG